MLLLIEKQSCTCIAKIDDANYSSVSKAFDIIGHPEFTKC